MQLEADGLVAKPVQNSLVDSSVRIRERTFNNGVSKNARIFKNERFLNKIAVEYDARALAPPDDTESSVSKCPSQGLSKDRRLFGPSFLVKRSTAVNHRYEEIPA